MTIRYTSRSTVKLFQFAANRQEVGLIAPTISVRLFKNSSLQGGPLACGREDNTGSWQVRWSTNAKKLVALGDQNVKQRKTEVYTIFEFIQIVVRYEKRFSDNITGHLSLSKR